MRTQRPERAPVVGRLPVRAAVTGDYPRTMSDRRRTIRESFEALRANGRIGLLPFITAGYPDLATTAAALPALEAGGATAVEIGIPFSDPIADGPTIQE